MERKKISHFFDLGRLSVPKIDEECQARREALGILAGNYNPLVPTYLFGIEVEVERVRFPGVPILNWSTVEDGSLRNHGVEFVSKPTAAKNLDMVLYELYRYFDSCSQVGDTPEFTNRCSTHVHMNVRDLSIDALYNTVLIYMVFERALFNWVGHERDKNIFCVPLHECDVTDALRGIFESDPRDFIHEWSKYTALNLLPIRDYGTIEFRHLEGTYDQQRILKWVDMLSHIKSFAQKNPLSETLAILDDINSVSNYVDFAERVFGPHAHALIQVAGQDQFCKDMSRCVSYTKRALVAGSKRSPKRKVNPFAQMRPPPEHAREAVRRQEEHLQALAELRQRLDNQTVPTTTNIRRTVRRLDAVMMEPPTIQPIENVWINEPNQQVEIRGFDPFDAVIQENPVQGRN